MKRTRRDLSYRLRIKRAAANVSLREVSALLGGNPSIWILHRIETRKQKPKPEQAALLVRMPFKVLEILPASFFKWRRTLAQRK